MKNSKKLILGAAVLLLIVLGVYSYTSVIRFFTGDNNMSVDGCPYFDGHRLGSDAYFESCHGVISILNNNICDCYRIYDDMHGYQIIGVESDKQYLLANGYMYIYSPVDKDNPEKYLTFEGDGKKFHPKEFFVDGELKSFLYDDIDRIPEYLRVDIATGEVSLYNIQEDMSEEDRVIFQGLEL